MGLRLTLQLSHVGALTRCSKVISLAIVGRLHDEGWILTFNRVYTSLTTACGIGINKNVAIGPAGSESGCFSDRGSVADPQQDKYLLEWGSANACPSLESLHWGIDQGFHLLFEKKKLLKNLFNLFLLFKKALDSWNLVPWCFWKWQHCPADWIP